MEGLGIHQPRREAPLNHNTFNTSTEHVVASILGEVALDPLYHDATMESGQTSGREHKADIYSAYYVEAVPEFMMDRQRKMDRASQIRHWMNIPPCARSHTALGKQYFCNNILIRYQAIKKNLPEKSDGCTTKKTFTLQHALQCKVGGIVIFRLNKVRDSLAPMTT